MQTVAVPFESLTDDGLHDSDRSSSPFMSIFRFFSKLPSELKDMVISNIHVKDRVNLRLMSRSFAISCTEGVCPDGIFTVRPHLHDMARLETVSLHPEISKGVTHLQFFVGDVGLERMRMAVDNSLTDERSGTFCQNSESSITRYRDIASASASKTSIGPFAN